MKHVKVFCNLRTAIALILAVNLTGCAWVNAAGRVYQGIGDGLTTASNETKPGFSKSLFGLGGKVGKAVGNILVDASGNDSKNNSASLNTEERQQVVSGVQSRLNQLGYNAGPNDGQMGKRTASAIKQYQKDNGLDASGSITKELVNSLGITKD